MEEIIKKIKSYWEDMKDPIYEGTVFMNQEQILWGTFSDGYMLGGRFSLFDYPLDGLIFKVLGRSPIRLASSRFSWHFTCRPDGTVWISNNHVKWMVREILGEMREVRWRKILQDKDFPQEVVELILKYLWAPTFAKEERSLFDIQ